MYGCRPCSEIIMGNVLGHECNFVVENGLTEMLVFTNVLYDVCGCGCGCGVCVVWVCVDGWRVRVCF